MPNDGRHRSVGKAQAEQAKTHLAGVGVHPDLRRRGRRAGGVRLHRHDHQLQRHPGRQRPVDRPGPGRLERHRDALQPWLRAAGGGGRAVPRQRRAAAGPGLRARRLVLRRQRLLVGARHRRIRPVRLARRVPGGQRPAPAAHARGRHVHGRPDQLPHRPGVGRPRAGRGHLLRPGGRRRGPQQLPAQRRVRDDRAAAGRGRRADPRLRVDGGGHRRRSRAEHGGRLRPVLEQQAGPGSRSARPCSTRPTGRPGQRRPRPATMRARRCKRRRC